MIIGIGADIIEVQRIKNLAEKSPRFLERVFTSQEIQYSHSKKNRFQHLAARFAAKEAFFKALGRKIRWTEVSVVNLSSGKPTLEFSTQEPLPFDTAQVSLSHLKHYAIAFVILEKSE